MVVDELAPLGGGVRVEEFHAGVFGDGDSLADGWGEFVGETEGFEEWVEEVGELVGVGFAGAEVGFEGGEGKAVDCVDFGVADVLCADTFFELIADFGVEGHESAASGWEVMVDGDQHLDDCEGLAGAGDSFEDEVAGGLGCPGDCGLLLGG